MQAYLMWEQAGKPDGANFSDDARRQLEQQLQSGKSVQDLERALKGPSDQPQQQEHQPAEVTDSAQHVDQSPGRQMSTPVLSCHHTRSSHLQIHCMCHLHVAGDHLHDGDILECCLHATPSQPELIAP